MAENNTQLYELGIHIIPTVAQNTLEETVRGIIALVEQYEGSVRGGELPQMRDLAYPISKEVDDVKKEYTTAYFGWMNLDMVPEKAEEFQHELNSDSSVLRFILIKKKEDDTPEGDMFNPSPKKKDDDHKEGEHTEEESMNDDEIDEKIDELVGEDE